VNVAEDQIYERYQAKAIAEINALGHDIAEWLRETHPGAAPVLGTGHPLADILLLKYSPLPAETQEGVAFFGRSGQAILKSLQRLRIDPLMLYGTDCVKAAVDPADADLAQCRLWLTREIHITQPRMIVAMGDAAHASPPSMAQGASMAVGAATLEITGPDPSTIASLGLFGGTLAGSGTRTITRSSIITASITWVTSLVRRVISPPVSSRSRLPNDSACTLRNSVPRRSAPKLWAASTVNTPQPTPPTRPISATPSIHSPVLITTPMSDRATP